MPTDEYESVAWGMVLGAAITNLLALLISPDVTSFFLAGLVIFAYAVERAND